MDAGPTLRSKPAAPHDMVSDDALMRRVGAGDGQAFRQLVERHAKRPHRIAWRMLGDAGEAEDVAQEACLRLWKDAPRWQPQGAGVGAWLARVATNLCLDRLRRRARLSDEEVPDRADPAPLADEVIGADQQQARVRAALDALPERQRAAVVLTYYEELPNAEAAAALELNIKAFESLLLRARRALKDRLVESTDG
jgi:RNA polymerase sigma-70 factor (ECF subfamily)